jgi:phosphoglycolate phosphatase-like HAD superfamily hydrolase
MALRAGCGTQSTELARKDCDVTRSHDGWTFIFDVDGTLVDSAAAIVECWRETLQTFGHTYSFDGLHRFSGMAGPDLLARVLPREALGDMQEIEDAQAKRYRTVYLPGIKAFVGVRELFMQLRADGHAIGLATSCRRDELHVYERQLQILDLVGAVACGSDDARGKPHPDLYERVVHGLAPRTLRHVIAVGDTPYDAMAARALGIRPIGTVTGGFSQSQLEDAGCIAVCLGPTDLAQYLRSPAAIEERLSF